VISLLQILPACGEGDREAVEGVRVLALRRQATIAPSVSRFATATSPQVGRIV
jgi:hypothetical protein